MVSDIIRPDDTDDKPGVDGTPGWAYDEDGYCVACGNGRWKHHMPECELRDALDAVAIVRDLAATDPVISMGGSDYDEYVCTACPDDWVDQQPFTEQAKDLRHAETCPWVRSQAWVSAHPVSGDPQ